MNNHAWATHSLLEPYFKYWAEFILFSILALVALYLLIRSFLRNSRQAKFGPASFLFEAAITRPVLHFQGHQTQGRRSPRRFSAPYPGARAASPPWPPPATRWPHPPVSLPFSFRPARF
jgi:hypothetical protein